MKKLGLILILTLGVAWPGYGQQSGTIKGLTDGNRAQYVYSVLADGTINSGGGAGGGGDFDKVTFNAAFGTAGTADSQVMSVQGIASGTPLAVTSTSTPATATTVVSTALEASHVLKASAGTLVSLHWLNAKTSSQYLLIMNSTTVPSDGAVTLLYPPIFMPATSNGSVTFPAPLTASTGISVSNSSTGTFTKTIGSADCVFTAQVR